MEKASIQAVAKEAGVSVSTVSRTFAKPELVLPQTRAKVMEAAKRLGFRISRSAAALKSGQSFRVAMLISGDVTTWFNANVYAGLDDVLHAAGYDIAVYPMADAEQRREFFTNLPVRRNADAVVVCSFNIEPEEVSKLKEMNVPVLGVNIPSSEGFDGGVSIDDHAAERVAAEHLIALGHRRIAFVGYAPAREGDDGSADAMRFSATARLHGLLEACAAHPDVEAVPLFIEHDEHATNAALNAVINATPAPTAVALCDDDLAIPMLFRMRQYGRRIPDDLSVVGFDDARFAREVGLTTLRQNPRAMGAEVARIALAMIGAGPEGMRPDFRTPPVQLMLRESTAPLAS